MSASLRAEKGLRLVCPVCGREVTVIRDADGALAPRCCNVPMERKDTAPFLRCPVCGAEVTVLAGRLDALAPRCCNVPMEPVA